MKIQQKGMLIMGAAEMLSTRKLHERKLEQEARERAEEYQESKMGSSDYDSNGHYNK